MTKNIAVVRGGRTGTEIVERTFKMLDMAAELYRHIFNYNGSGCRTADIMNEGMTKADCKEYGKIIVNNLKNY